MPFTFAHPAAALPFKRLLGRHGILSALAIGSMMPDLPFFLGIALPRWYTHTLFSLISWSLPCGLLLYALFHGIYRQALIDLAPLDVQARLPEDTSMVRGWRGWSAVGVSLVCGAATHLLWDAFTHPDTLIVQSTGFLRWSLASVGGHDLYVFGFLQHASTVLGLSLLALWSRRWYLSTAPDRPLQPALQTATRWRIVISLALAPLAVGAAAAWGAGWDPQRLPTFVFTTLPVFFWLLTTFALLRWFNRRQAL